jgi:hypothetical protein
VGGLLFVGDCASGLGHHAVAYDGNGNVMALVDAATGALSAQYEYGPFGELVRATGPMPKANPFRWSTVAVHRFSQGRQESNANTWDEASPKRTG